MFNSRLALSLVAAALICGGLSGQERNIQRTAPMGERQGGGNPVDHSRGEGRGRPTGLPVHRNETIQPGRGNGTGVAKGREQQPRPHKAEIAVSRYSNRCFVLPDHHYWKQRDIMAEIQWMARQGSIPVLPVAEDVSEFTGVANFPSGLKAYGFAVPAGGKLHVRLHHGNEGWFRLAMVNKWGGQSQGMLQNLIPTGNPEVSYSNPGKEPQAVYVIVDDPGWMSSATNPFTLTAERNWEAGKADTQGIKLVVGIWASNSTAGVSAEYSSR